MCEPTTMFLIGSGIAIYQGAQKVEEGKYELAMGEYQKVSVNIALVFQRMMLNRCVLSV